MYLITVNQVVGSLVIILAHAYVNLQLVTVSLPQPMCILLVSNVLGLLAFLKCLQKVL